MRMADQANLIDIESYAYLEYKYFVQSLEVLFGVDIMAYYITSIL